MKKFIVSVFIIGAFVLFSIVYSRSNPAVVTPVNTTSSSTSTRSSATVTATSTATGSSSSGTTPTPTVVAQGQYKDGSYVGQATDMQWGTIQVKAVVQNGKITDVQFLQAPNDRNRSITINQYADPQLTQEAIQAQSANVDVITGATDTSEAFIQSLTDALSQAKA